MGALASRTAGSAIRADDAPCWRTATPSSIASLAGAAALEVLGSTGRGLGKDEVDRRRAAVGPNALRSHGVQPWSVLARQLANPLLLLLAAAAAVSLYLGEGTDAVVIIVIVTMSVGLGFTNEYRSERAVEALHEAVHHQAVVRRDGQAQTVDVVDLVPGDIVELHLGDVVPADVRLLEATALECGEAALTGESIAVAKQSEPVRAR